MVWIWLYGVSVGSVCRVVSMGLVFTMHTRTTPPNISEPTNRKVTKPPPEHVQHIPKLGVAYLNIRQDELPKKSKQPKKGKKGQRK